jgi:hypothetical protein
LFRVDEITALVAVHNERLNDAISLFQVTFNYPTSLTIDSYPAVSQSFDNVTSESRAALLGTSSHRRGCHRPLGRNRKESTPEAGGDPRAFK